jgi:RNA polymerase sigma factor (sigma-70 family)
MAEIELSAEGPARSSLGAGDDEEQLVRRAQMGSVVAFERLVVERGPDLYRYLAVRLRNEGDARDALQETLTAAWQGLPALRDPQRFWPWLVAIAAHKAADALRARAPMATSQPDAVADVDADTIEVRDALDRLPARSREVLLLRFGLHLSEREVAAVLGVRVGTVKSRCARARKRLEELLQ